MKITIQVDSEIEVVAKLCEVIQDIAKKSIEADGRFTIGLSGGSLIKYLCQGLPCIKTVWDKWYIFFCDERVVPVSSEDSTYGAYLRNLKIKIPNTHFFPIKQGVSAEEAAVDYRSKLEEHVKFVKSMPRFNLLVLGVGPDGHTCSLFPDHPLLNETSLTVAHIIDSPKPPPERITLTYPVINNAEYCVFAVSGKGKADILKRILTDEEPLPAARVNPHGTVYWIADREASSLL